MRIPIDAKVEHNRSKLRGRVNGRPTEFDNDIYVIVKWNGGGGWPAGYVVPVSDLTVVPE